MSSSMDLVEAAGKHGASRRILDLSGQKNGYRRIRLSKMLACTALDIMQIGLTEKKTFSTFMILADRCWTVFETPHRYDMMKKYVLEVSLVHSVVDPLTEPSCICWTQHGRTCDKAGIVIHLGCSLFCPFICLLRHICLRSEIRHVHRLQSGSMQWFSWGHRIEARILRRF